MGVAQHQTRPTTFQAYSFFLCHFLSTWNARSYEFAAVIFTTTIYGDNFAATSADGITKSVFQILLSTALGNWIDHAPSRLRSLLTTIFVNRGTVILSCILWLCLISDKKVLKDDGAESLGSSSLDGVPKHVLFALLLAMGVVEKLSRMANVLSVETDWVSALAPPSQEVDPLERFGLTHMNVVLKRLDLIAKLASPAAISALLSVLQSVRWMVVAVMIMNLLSWGLEYWTAKKLWDTCSCLREPKQTHDYAVPTHKPNAGTSETVLERVSSSYQTLKVAVVQQVGNIRNYFSSDIWMPSIAWAMLHLSVLTWSATMIVYLLATGFSLTSITWAQGLGALAELCSTYISPWAISKLSPRSHQPGHRLATIYEAEDEDLEELLGSDAEADVNESPQNGDLYDEQCTAREKQRLKIGIVRLGMTSVSSMSLSLLPVALVIWLLPVRHDRSSQSQIQIPTPPTPQSAFPVHPLTATTLFLFLSLSQLGVFFLKLATQQLIQLCVPSSTLSTFFGTEMSFSSVFALLHWVAAAVLNRPSDFGVLAAGSLVTAAVSTGLFAKWKAMHKNGILL